MLHTGTFRMLRYKQVLIELQRTTVPDIAGYSKQ